MKWLIYGMLAVFGWGFGQFFEKIAVEKSGWYDAGFASVVGALSAFLIIAVLTRMPNPGSQGVPFGLFGGVVGGFAFAAFCKSLEGGNLAVVAPLAGLYLVVTVLLSVIILKEKMSVYQIAGIVMAIVSIAMLSIE